jgi:hypothetical protein
MEGLGHFASHFVPEKPDRYGIEAYLVSKSKSGYIYYIMEVSTGKS